MNERFLICEICGNLIGRIHDSGVPMECCGQEMNEITANTVEASQEKHIPVVTRKDEKLVVSVGSAVHPMQPEHFIQWMYLETKQGGQRKALVSGQEPTACFTLCEDEAVAAFAYCNLHGLWKVEI